MKRSILILIALSFAVPTQARRRAANPPLFPQCTVVNGTPAVTFTRDDGRTLAEVAQPLGGIGYTYGLVALDTPRTLLSWHRDTISISTDAGCSWTPVGDVTGADFPPRFIAAKGGRAYAISDSRSFFLRYDARGAVVLKSPGVLIGAGSDPNDGTHVRVVDDQGIVWDSADAGESWTRIGNLADAPPLLYRAVFDPNDVNHIVIGALARGAYVTHDGGKNWMQSSLRSNINVFTLEISPADGNTVWAEGIDMTDDLRHIWLSRDGGTTYSAVIDQEAGVQLINGNIMAASPHDPNVLYFVFGTHFQNYGTDFFKFDASSRTLSMAHNPYDDVNAIAFSREDPRVIYLGLESEKGTH
jgi:hypothetical protein